MCILYRDILINPIIYILENTHVIGKILTKILEFNITFNCLIFFFFNYNNIVIEHKGGKYHLDLLNCFIIVL